MPVEQILIQMENPCVDCKKDWAMEEREMQWWSKKLKEAPELTFPKRCPECRKKKKAASQREYRFDTVEELRGLSFDIEQSNTADNDQALTYGDIKERIDRIADTLEKVRKEAKARRGNRRNDLQTKA